MDWLPMWNGRTHGLSAFHGLTGTQMPFGSPSAPG